MATVGIRKKHTTSKISLRNLWRDYLFTKSVKRLFVHKIHEEIICSRYLEELNLANMAPSCFFFRRQLSHTCPPHVKSYVAITVPNFISLFLFLFFLLGVDTHLKVPRFPQPHCFLSPIADFHFCQNLFFFCPSRWSLAILLCSTDYLFSLLLHRNKSWPAVKILTETSRWNQIPAGIRTNQLFRTTGEKSSLSSSSWSSSTASFYLILCLAIILRNDVLWWEHSHVGLRLCG